MIQPIQPQYQSPRNSTQRRGLKHVSGVVERLMRIYGLEDDFIDHQEFTAAEQQSQEFSEPVVMMPNVSLAGTQSTFAWFGE